MVNIENSIANISQILSISLCRIRAAGWNGDPALAAIEADHVHNLPSLITSLVIPGSEQRGQLLAFYLNVERKSYEAQLRDHALHSDKKVDFNEFLPLWKALEKAGSNLRD